MNTLFYLLLIACVLRTGETWDFTSGQYCASLYNAADFEGDSFNVTEGSGFSNLEEEQVSSSSAWNITLSFQVEAGCTVRVCNDSYYDGECADFDEGQATIPKPFENILSVSCSCSRQCKCEDVYNIRKKSCARAYLFEGGCNRCNPYYTEIKEGESDTFPEEFEANVSSLMVRPGCSLTVFDEMDHLGDPQTVENTVESWTQPIRSYECSCGPEAASTTPPTERPPDYPTPISIPNSLDEIMEMINGDYGGHPGLLAALRSNKGKRSTKNAYILFLGSTGAGKSTTINMLFDNPDFGSRRQVNKFINEFRIPVPVDELGIQNSELRLIEAPGLGDTQGPDKDAESLATLEEFLDNHEELKDRIPNVVFIFHKFSDNRFSGEGSQFVKMLRGFDSFRERLTDKKYSNVIFVFSHFTSESRRVIRNPKRKIEAFKKVIEEYSRFPRPIVLAVAENKAEDQDLPMMNGHYKLPNGDYYPKNLFDKITQATRGAGDTIGDAVIRSALTNPDSFNVSSSDFSLSAHQTGKIPKYLGILFAPVLHLTVTKTEITEKLRVVHETMDPELKKKFPDALYYLQKSLSLYNYRTETDLPRTKIGIVKFLMELRQNEAVLYLLNAAFGITPPVLKENVLTGYSYNVFKDHPLPVSPFKLGELQNSPIGYKFPSMITCNVEPQTKDIIHLFKDRKEYLEERVESLNIEDQISISNFIGVIKPGYNILNEITSADQNLTAPITAVREFRTFQLVLNENFNFTDEFMRAVESLTPFNDSDHTSVTQWKSFFDTYGTHVVNSVYGGGAIEIEMKMDEISLDNVKRVLMTSVQFAEDISLLANATLSPQGVTHSLSFVGGDKDYHTTDLTKFPLEEASNLMEKWKDSLHFSPTILTNELRLLPISEITKRLGQNVSCEIDRVTKLLFNSSLTYKPGPSHEGATLESIGRLAQQMTSFIEESRKSDERLHQMMAYFREDQKRRDDIREKMHAEQVMMEQLRFESERRKQEREDDMRRRQIEAEERMQLFRAIAARG